MLMYSGVFWWNAHHHWWTFGHLLFLTHKQGPQTHLLRGVGDFLGSQLLLVGPVLFVGIIAGGLGCRQWIRQLQSTAITLGTRRASPPAISHCASICSAWDGPLLRC